MSDTCVTFSHKLKTDQLKIRLNCMRMFTDSRMKMVKSNFYVIKDTDTLYLKHLIVLNC